MSEITIKIANADLRRLIEHGEIRISLDESVIVRDPVVELQYQGLSSDTGRWESDDSR